MKFTGFILTTLLTITSMATTFAPSVMPAENMKVEMLGKVTFDKSYTMTCMALNCPPSQPYYQLTLEDVHVAGLGEVETVVFEDFKKVIGTDVKPDYVVYGGVTLTEGTYVMVKAEIIWNAYGEKVYVVAANPEEIRLAPVRHPGMLF